MSVERLGSDSRAVVDRALRGALSRGSNTIDVIDLQAVLAGADGAHRLQVCLSCRGSHLTVPQRLGPHAMTWPDARCADTSCPAFGHELAIMKSPFERIT